MSLHRPAGPRAPARGRRAASFALTSAALAWLAHGVAGGALPSPWLLLIGAVAVAACAGPVLGREASGPTIVVALLAAQLGLHGWLALTATHAGHAGGHGHTGRMVAAHLVATAAAAVWLRFAEQRIWGAARRSWIAALVLHRRWLDVPSDHPEPPRRPVGWWLPDAHIARWIPAAVGMRGPPGVVGP